MQISCLFNQGFAGEISMLGVIALTISCVCEHALLIFWNVLEWELELELWIMLPF